MSKQKQVSTSRAGVIIGLVVFLILGLMPTPDGMSPEGQRLLAVTALMSSWWLTQAIPIAATSLVPLVAFPLLGIQLPGDVSNFYMDKLIFLFLGGFIIALGIEKWGLHERIALHIVRILGTSLRRVVLGFMVATAFLSMWISNTASTLLMTPIGLALIVSIQKSFAASDTTSSDKNRSDDTSESGGPLRGFGIALMLGIAWSASIGGLTTLVGTPTNVQFVGLWERRFPASPEISAGLWMSAFVPVGIVLLLLAWAMLVYRLPGNNVGIDRHFFTQRLKSLGPPTTAEKRMLAVFFLTACLWTFSKSMAFGEHFVLPGRDDFVKWLLVDQLGATVEFASNAMHDSTVAIGMALLLFLLPSGQAGDDGEPQRLMDWETAVRLPWSVLLLVGGGFAIAGAFEQTGLARWIGDAFASGVSNWPVWALIMAVCFLMTFLTEFATNVVVVSVLLPVMAEAAIGLNIDPRLLMFPAAASASCAFMLPIGTPPNAIVFGTGSLNMSDMAKRGFILNLIGVLLMTIATVFYLVPHLGLSTTELPDWAQPADGLGQ
jgi:solute carrier family 13 (sodium-dependent dicarboxylate transporter), member 2/3/5